MLSEEGELTDLAKRLKNIMGFFLAHNQNHGLIAT
tara:strand:+ start:538 stop:642 length:105 start_codon:yes stop_codon:yes gene_type:complete